MFFCYIFHLNLPCNCCIFSLRGLFSSFFFNRTFSCFLPSLPFFPSCVSPSVTSPRRLVSSHSYSSFCFLSLSFLHFPSFLLPFLPVSPFLLPAYFSPPPSFSLPPFLHSISPSFPTCLSPIPSSYPFSFLTSYFPFLSSYSLLFYLLISCPIPLLIASSYLLSFSYLHMLLSPRILQPLALPQLLTSPYPLLLLPSLILKSPLRLLLILGKRPHNSG